MNDEKDIVSLEEGSIEENREIELTEEEKILIRIQELDIELENYEYIPYEEMTEELYEEMVNIKKEIKDLKKQLKAFKKEKSVNSWWDKLNIGYVIYGVFAMFLVAYPVGPRISVHYFNVVFGIMKLFNGIEISDTLSGLIIFLLYLTYYIIIIGIDLIIYRFIKKNKTNLWTMVTITSLHLLASIISVSIVFDSFF